MPSKRDVLGQLKRDELLAALDEFGLDVQDRRVRDQLVEALAGSRKALNERLPSMWPLVVKSMFFRRTFPCPRPMAGVKGGAAGEANP